MLPVAASGHDTYSCVQGQEYTWLEYCFDCIFSFPRQFPSIIDSFDHSLSNSHLTFCFSTCPEKGLLSLRSLYSYEARNINAGIPKHWVPLECRILPVQRWTSSNVCKWGRVQYLFTGNVQILQTGAKQGITWTFLHNIIFLLILWEFCTMHSNHT